MLQRWKKNSKKGFTLVELIVVLVILAILAALLIPALTGYIDKAKEKQIIAETRQVVMAAQTLADELYAQDATKNITFDDTSDVANRVVAKSEVAKLAALNAAYIVEIKVGNPTDNNTKDRAGVVIEVKYTRDGKTCTYTKTNPSEPGKYEFTTP